MRKSAVSNGFTIVELLIVIVIIGILAALIIIGYTGIQRRVGEAKQDADVSQLVKAINLARETTGKVLLDITQNTYTMYGCAVTGGNPSGTELKDLPHNFNDMGNTSTSVNHRCWQDYWRALDRIASASGANLTALKKGDARGNPYMIDENEDEDEEEPCFPDIIYIYEGKGVEFRRVEVLSNVLPGC